MILIKIGGGRTINIEGIISDLTSIDEDIIIVHGANAYRDELLEQLGLEKKVVTSVSGYSSVISDEKALEVLTMAYAGLRNKKIVGICQQNGINAIGLSGVDGKVIQGERNKGIRVRENGKLKILRDFSGKPRQINKDLLQLLLTNGYTPVLCVPIIDENNIAINSENDDIIGLLQKEFGARLVIQFIEERGFLEKKDDPNSLVQAIEKSELVMREEQVEGRMKRKIFALRKLFENGANEVIIADGRTENPVADALKGKGTKIS